MDRGAWGATVHGVLKRSNTTQQLNKTKRYAVIVGGNIRSLSYSNLSPLPILGTRCQKTFVKPAPIMSENQILKGPKRTFLGRPLVTISPSNAGCAGSTPGQGAGIPHAHSQNTKTQKRSNIVTNSRKTFFFKCQIKMVACHPVLQGLSQPLQQLTFNTVPKELRVELRKEALYPLGKLAEYPSDYQIFSRENFMNPSSYLSILGKH